MGGFEPDPALTYDRVLDGIAAAGFTGTELGDWGFMPDNPVKLQSELIARGLEMIGAFTPVRLTDGDAHGESEAAAVRAARLLKASSESPARRPGPFVILAEASTRERLAVAGRVGEGHALTLSQWGALARGAERIAKRVRDEAGLSTVFHHHCGTPVETLDETVRFMEMTDPGLVGLCYDSGHFAYAGTDPLEALKRFGDRTWHVHFKDFRAGIRGRARREGWDYHRAVAGGLFCELGAGDIDFPRLMGHLQSIAYSGWIVIEDEIPPGSGDPFENAKRDRAYLRRLGL